MNNHMPLVSIGIPTYNRAALLKRAIESARNQNYTNIEILISDNASSDETEDLCHQYRRQDSRIKYFRHSKNLGPVANFNQVLKNSAGEFFMWLGDDDWIDSEYISSCIEHLLNDSNLVIVGGLPVYYLNQEGLHRGRVLNLGQKSWWLRVILYYCLVKENGIFYGLMRTAQLKHLEMLNVLGGDWLLIAQIVSLGRAKILKEVVVHRELGGNSSSLLQMVSSLRVSRIHAFFPLQSTAIKAWIDIVINGPSYHNKSRFSRLAVGTTVFLVLMIRSLTVYLTVAKKVLKKLRLKLLGQLN